MYKIVWLVIIGIAIVVNILNGSMKMLASHNWMGIEAIVNFFWIAGSTWMFFRQQKQIDEQKREADGDKKKLMLMNQMDWISQNIDVFKDYTKSLYGPYKHFDIESKEWKFIKLKVNVLRFLRFNNVVLKDLVNDIHFVLDEIEKYIDNYDKDGDFLRYCKFHKGFKDLLKEVYRYFDLYLCDIYMFLEEINQKQEIEKFLFSDDNLFDGKRKKLPIISDRDYYRCIVDIFKKYNKIIKQEEGVDEAHFFTISKLYFDDESSELRNVYGIEIPNWWKKPTQPSSSSHQRMP